MNPYEILGVGTGATFSEIKAAYRSKSKQHHPDAGGDVEAFQAVVGAWEILSDPDERAFFDRNGKAKTVDRKDSRSALIEVIAKMFDDCLSALLEVGVAWSDADIMAGMSHIAKDRLGKHKQELSALEYGLAECNKLKTRIKRNDVEENVFSGIIESKILKIEAGKAKLDEQVVIMEKVVAELSNYESPVQMMQTMNRFRNSTSSWTFNGAAW